MGLRLQCGMNSTLGQEITSLLSLQGGNDLYF